MRILITGGCGFVGSNLAVRFKQQDPGNEVVVFDNLKRRGSELNVSRLRNHEIQFVHGDIRNIEDLQFSDPFDLIIDAAAEPSVLAGLDGSTQYVINTNLNGTINTLQLAKQHQAKFIFLSTSRVYPIEKLESANFIEDDTRFRWTADQSEPGISPNGIQEHFSIEGARSLYGASKLASELFIQEFHDMFGLETVINRCGVLTGPYQMGKVDQGVIVLWAARHYWKQPLKYFGYGGKGKQVRDILHVDDLFELLQLQLARFADVNGQTYNVGGGLSCSLSLLELTELCRQISGNHIDIGSVPENRAADIRIFLSDCTKVHSQLGWAPKRNPTQILEEIMNWIDDNEAILAPILK